MKGLVFTICSLVITFSAFAQQNTYETIKIKAVENLRSGDFASAKSRLNLMEPYIDDSNRNEYQSLLNQLQDSINNSYNKANVLREKKQYEIAIIEYQRLIKRDKEPLIKPLYAHIGYCYEVRSTNNEYFKKLARDNYQLGIQHNENLSALRMAWFIRENNISATTEEMIELYEKAPNYYAAMDSLGVEYGRLGRLNESYKWYRKSQSSFSKYNMALYLLDTSTYTQLAEEYKSDDPIKLLAESADEGYTLAKQELNEVNNKDSEIIPISQQAKKDDDIIVEPPVNPWEEFWDDFVDAFTPEDQTWGLGYSFSQHFPLTLSANYTYSCLSLSTELGINLDGKKYTTKEYNPNGYWVISPGFYCRFLSINCGVGFMTSSYMKTQTYTEDFFGESEDGSISVDGSISITIEHSATKFNFILKPSITGYIPISSEDYYITINAGYNYIHKFKELNGWSFGVGFQVIW